MWSRALLVLGLAWLAWRGSLAALELVRECAGAPRDVRRAFADSEDQRIRTALAALDRKYGFPAGYQLGIYRAVLEHVPPWSTIHFDLRHDEERARALAPIQPLAFPRFVRRNRDALPEEIGERLEADYFLTFSAESRAPLEGSRTPLASGDAWTLWH